MSKKFKRCLGEAEDFLTILAGRLKQTTRRFLP